MMLRHHQPRSNGGMLMVVLRVFGRKNGLETPPICEPFPLIFSLSTK